MMQKHTQPPQASVNQSYPGPRFNNTFRGDHSSSYNACVGENGLPSYYEYANGYADAAIVLIENAIKKLNVDEQVYPICFNMRHSVELRLKHQIKLLGYIRTNISLEEYDASKSHDIGILWKFFKEKAPIFDRRFASKLDELDPYIMDIAEIDPTGQTFRYPLSNESVKHLAQVALINVLLLKKQFTSLRAKLEDLFSFTEFLIEEYGWGTKTKNLSRHDIHNIAKKLPPYKDWATSLAAVKGKIKFEYKIGSREFSECIELIKFNYSFAHLIEINIELKFITFESLSIFFSEAIKLDNNRKSSPTTSKELPFSISEVEKSQSELADATMHCTKNIPVKEYIDLAALFELGRHGVYSEHYTNYLSTLQSDLSIIENNQNLYYQKVYYILCKRNTYKTILKSLKLLNQNETISKLKELFDLS